MFKVSGIYCTEWWHIDHIIINIRGKLISLWVPLYLASVLTILLMCEAQILKLDLQLSLGSLMSWKLLLNYLWKRRENFADGYLLNTRFSLMKRCRRSGRRNGQQNVIMEELARKEECNSDFVSFFTCLLGCFDLVYFTKLNKPPSTLLLRRGSS